jgi:hypothetical protein
VGLYLIGFKTYCTPTDHRRVFDSPYGQSPAHVTASSDTPLVSLPNASPTLAPTIPNPSPIESESGSLEGNTVVGHPSVTGANAGQSPISQNLVERAEASDKRRSLSSSVSNTCHLTSYLIIN